MATQRGIDMAMDMFMATFNKKPDWKDNIQPVWSNALDKVKDKVLWDSMMRVCTKKWQYPPTLGHVIETVEAVIKELGGTGLVLREYKYCESCIERDGVVEVACHFLVAETKKMKTYTGITRCGCAEAKSKYPVMESVAELYSRMDSDARMTIIRWHHTDGAQPFLTMQQRHPNAFLEWMTKEIQLKKAQGIPNPYEQMVGLIVKGHVPNDIKHINRFPTKVVAKPTTTHYNKDTDIDPDDCIY